MAEQIAGSQKAHAARSQLGTALYLYLRRLDPVSVHALACGGLEVAEGLAERADAAPFSVFALEVHPEETEGSLKALRNTAWNAMKHAQDRKGRQRDDEELLAGRWAQDNEALLWEGWFNLAQAGVPLPIEAQVFQLWMLALHADQSQLDPANLEAFPNLHNLPEPEQHRLLMEAIELAQPDDAAITDSRTDPRPLVLPR